ncbi:hypothetical protein HZA44_03715 [Candidatus Peregrinibacteria bacterium]|nr:hypothetical protein [Candidatus Peregrinibacteria bacterium]
MVPTEDAREVCQKEDVQGLVAKGEKIAQEKIDPCPLREKVLEDFAQLRTIVELALAKQLEVVIIAHRLMMAIVEAGKTGFQELLARREAETRAKINQILDPFGNLDED